MKDDKRKLQKTILIITKEIHKICIKHNIPYSLDGGSMLGAVRHKGFIPWDDDMDIAMRRTDFERFINTCKDELDAERFFIQTEFTEKNYCFAFAKIRLLNTKIIEDFSENVGVNKGIFVDVFPYDNLPDNFFTRKVFLFLNHILKNLIWIKCGYGSPAQRRKLKNRILEIMGKFVSIKCLKKLRYRLITSYNDKNTVFCFTSDYPRTMLKNSWFDSFEYYSFENMKLKGYKEFDAYLTNAYGNYMEFPPENERVCHSNYDIDFGIYDTEADS